ncbi:hypothetical protein [Acinetobacter junii]|uniref:hypothetical protein n=2 Tax=Acinetobacter junii TaxID=40215 RepID=UPI0019029A00|nr:hypothetical protein [Acinetobacter junii]MBJ8440888.1 hypothetical protein [Acinetobacter junii]
MVKQGENMKMDLEGRPYLTQYSDDGFIDCVFRIMNLTETKTSYKFHMTSSFNGEILGLNAEVIKSMEGGLDNDMHLIQEHVYRAGVILFRSGIESDNLLNSLSHLYQLPFKKQHKMREVESFTAIALHQGNLNMREEQVRIKIFGRDDEEQYDLDKDYNESFFNLDLKNGFVYWNEKDESYRESLINGLSEENCSYNRNNTFL